MHVVQAAIAVCGDCVMTPLWGRSGSGAAQMLMLGSVGGGFRAVGATAGAEEEGWWDAEASLSWHRIANSAISSLALGAGATAPTALLLVMWLLVRWWLLLFVVVVVAAAAAGATPAPVLAFCGGPIRDEKAEKAFVVEGGGGN